MSRRRSRPDAGFKAEITMTASELLTRIFDCCSNRRTVKLWLRPATVQVTIWSWELRAVESDFQGRVGLKPD